MKSLLFVAATSLTAACSWSQFDDLADSTTVRAAEKPDGVKATEYGTSIAGCTLPGETSGGKIAVLSSGSGNYSTLKLDPGGVAQDLGDNETLGVHTIDSVTPKGVVLFDGVGQVALIDNSNVQTVVAITGTPDALGADIQIPTPAAPDATAFVNGRVVVGVTTTATSPTNANVFSKTQDGVTSCLLTDGTAAAVSPAAVAIDASTLWIYAKSGALFSYTLAALDACVSTGMTTVTVVAPNPGTIAGPPAANLGHLDIASDGSSKYAILTAYDTALTTTGMVEVVNITTASAPVMVATAAAPGVHAATYDTFDGAGVLVLGYPSRADGSTAGAGAVDLHTFSGGTFSTTASETLSIPTSDSNHLFGRAVTTTRYNGKPIVVVAADNVVYSFYQTALYAKR